MSFQLKSTPYEFQHIINDIFNYYSKFSMVYIDDVPIYSKKLDQHVKHLKIFFNVTKSNGLAVSASKMKLFHTKIQF